MSYLRVGLGERTMYAICNPLHFQDRRWYPLLDDVEPFLGIKLTEPISCRKLVLKTYFIEERFRRVANEEAPKKSLCVRRHKAYRDARLYFTKRKWRRNDNVDPA